MAFACLPQADLRKAVLSNATHQVQLQGSWLRRAAFNESILMNANLRGAQCKKTDFQGANMKGASLEHSNITKCNLRNTDVERAILRGAAMSDGKWTALPHCHKRPRCVAGPRADS